MRWPADMQDADQREQPARRIEIDVDLAVQALAQQFGALVVQAAPAHVDGLDARRARGLDGLVVGLADGEVVAHHAAERQQRQRHGVERPVGLVENLHLQPVLGDREMQVVGAREIARRAEGVVLQQVVDGHGALVLDLRGAADHRRVVERDAGQTFAGPFALRGILLGIVGHARWPPPPVRTAPGWPPGAGRRSARGRRAPRPRRDAPPPDRWRPALRRRRKSARYVS